MEKLRWRAPSSGAEDRRRGIPLLGLQERSQGCWLWRRGAVRERQRPGVQGARGGGSGTGEEEMNKKGASDSCLGDNRRQSGRVGRGAGGTSLRQGWQPRLPLAGAPLLVSPCPVLSSCSQDKEGRGQLALPVAGSPSFVLGSPGRWWMWRGSLLSHPLSPLVKEQQAEPSTGRLLAFLEGSVPLGGTKKLLWRPALSLRAPPLPPPAPAGAGATVQRGPRGEAKLWRSEFPKTPPRLKG